MNADIEHVVNQCAMCLGYQQMQPQEKALHYEIPARPWKEVGTDVFMIASRTLLCIGDYHSKFPMVKKVNSLSADDLVQTTKLIFCRIWAPKETCFRNGYKLHI